MIFKSFPQIWECMFGQVFEKLLENQFYDEAETCLSHMMRSVFWMLFLPTRCRWIWPKINAVASRPAPDSWKKGTVDFYKYTNFSSLAATCIPSPPLRCLFSGTPKLRKQRSSSKDRFATAPLLVPTGFPGT